MRLTRFAVQGFRNITSRVELTGLDDINVIHGENDVGKSNLVEALAIGLYLARWSWFDPAGADLDQKWFVDVLQAHTLGQPTSVLLEISVSGDFRDFLPTHLLKLDATEVITLKLEVRPDLGKQKIRGQIWRNGEEINVNQIAPDGPAKLGKQISCIYAKDGSFQGSRIQLIDTDREDTTPNVSTAARPARSLREYREYVPPELSLELHKLKESLRSNDVKRWDLFRELCEQTGLVKASEVLVLSSSANKAQVAIERNGERVPGRMLGSGVQQLFTLLALIVTSKSQILAIEEPELNLRYSAQLRLRELLEFIVKDGRGPSQFILTSHSPAFEFGTHFYAMERGPDGPTVTKRPVAEAPAFLDYTGAAVPNGESKFAWLTQDGLVQVPEGVMARIGLEHGGNVVFVVDKDQQARMMTTKAFSAEYLGDDEPAQD